MQKSCKEHQNLHVCLHRRLDLASRTRVVRGVAALNCSLSAGHTLPFVREIVQYNNNTCMHMVLQYRSLGSFATGVPMQSTCIADSLVIRVLLTPLSCLGR